MPPQPPPVASDLEYLGSSESRDLSKIVLDALAEDGDGLFAYRLYLQNTVSFHVNHAVLGILDDELLEGFYMMAHPTRPPKYFDFGGGRDLAKLESALLVRAVVLARHGRSVTLVHDYAVTCSLTGREGFRTVHLLVDKARGSRGFSVYRQRPGGRTLLDWRLTADLYLTFASRLETSDSAGFAGLGRRLRRLLLPGCGEGELLPVSTLDEFFDSYPPYEGGPIPGVAFILVAHVRTRLMARLERMVQPNNVVFNELAVYDGSPTAYVLRKANPESIKKYPVVCVDSTATLALLSGEYARCAVEASWNNRRRNPKREPFPGAVASLSAPELAPDEAEELEMRDEAERKETRDRFGLETDGSRAERSGLLRDVSRQALACPCAGCADSFKYTANMSPNGRQRLYRTELALRDLLLACNRLDDETEEKLKACGELSVASFDVESMQEGVGDEGDEDVAFPEGDGGQTHARLPRKVFAVQEPVMIGFSDQASVAAGKEPLVFEDPDTMVKDFLEASFAARDRAKAAKKELLSDLYEWVEGYKRKHFEFHCERFGLEPPRASATTTATTTVDEDVEENDPDYERDDLFDPDDAYLSESEERVLSELGRQLDAEEEEEEEARRGGGGGGGGGDDEDRRLRSKASREVELAWKSSLFGKTEARLQRLESAFNVFAFNAEGFDLVILCSKMAVLAKERGCKTLRMQREGSRIRWVKIDGVNFSEVKRLAAAGSSLASMARSCGLEESKGIFPFDLLTDREFLSLPRLPSDAAQWHSVLGGPTSQEAVDSALETFDELGCASVGEYLRHYLRLDVVILQKCAVRLLAEYYDMLGLDYVDMRKFTVSSLSLCAAQHHLARNKRVGQFFVNKARTYSLLKLGVRGGLTFVGRTLAGSAVDPLPLARLLQEYLESFTAPTPDEISDAAAFSPDYTEEDRRAAAEVARKIEATPGASWEEKKVRYLVGCNAHVLRAEEVSPGKWVIYVDLNSLYPAAGSRAPRRTSSEPPPPPPPIAATGATADGPPPPSYRSLFPDLAAAAAAADIEAARRDGRGLSHAARALLPALAATLALLVFFAWVVWIVASPTTTTRSLPGGLPPLLRKG